MSAIDYLSSTDTVHIATELPDGGEIVTPIWAVVVDGTPYIRSGYGPQSKWYLRVQRTGRATFIDGLRRYPVTIENLNDEAIKHDVDAAYRTKYVGQGMALRQVVSAQVRAYAMRITLQ
ncbi:MAG TPA: DUF2255 family protein [Acidimicrobiales bacterium]|jgi:hypothetical protein|nr:DUF2255 family protein [Acidimicrobiales bacterium]